MFVWSILFLFLSVKGALSLCDYVLQIPPPRTKKALLKASYEKKSLMQEIADTCIDPLVVVLTPFIRLTEEKKRSLERGLARAGLKDTPEQYYARAFIKTAAMAVVPILMYLAGMQALVPFGCILIPLAYYNALTKYKEELNKKKKNIERGLPGFIRAILYKLNDNGSGVVKADLISIFEDYLQVANPVFAYDVSMLVTEMKSRDVEAALRNFANRVNIAEVSFLCNALIGVTRGERQQETLAALARDMDIKSKENIKRELDKRPGKVATACIPLVIIAMAAMLYVLVQNLVSGFTTLL